MYGINLITRITQDISYIKIVFLSQEQMRISMASPAEPRTFTWGRFLQGLPGLGRPSKPRTAVGSGGGGGGPYSC